MKSLQFMLMLLLGSPIMLPAQNFSKEFGKIDQETMDLTVYAPDTTASAVVLFDIGKSYFTRSGNGFDVVFERTTRIKILKQAGIHWAEVEIPVYQEGGIFEDVYHLEANTYNFENGVLNTTELNTSHVYQEKMNDYWHVKKFAMPNVKKGSVIEYKYKINSQYKFNLRDWKFQWKIPVMYSEYEVKMIPFYEYTWLLQGAKRFDKQTSFVDKGISRQFGSVEFQDKVHKYIMEDVPAFKSEDFITTVNDYIMKVDFQLSAFHDQYGSTTKIMSTWPQMIKGLSKHSDFGRYLKKSERRASRIIDLDPIKGKSDIENFDYILDYVKHNFKWNGEKRKYTTKSPREMEKVKNGNSSEINLLTVGLLRAAGIESYPVLISTRGHGKIRQDYPYLNYFNYVIILAHIDGKMQLADATGIQLPNNRIPERCLNDRGLIINRDQVDWVRLDCRFPSEISTNLDIRFSDDKSLIAKVRKEATEYDAARFRKKYGKDHDVIDREFSDADFTIHDTSIVVENQEQVKEPYILQYQMSGNTRVINNKIYIDPFLHETLSTNPLKEKTRIYPVDMVYPRKRTFQSTIHIPEGYDVEVLPEPDNLNNNLVDMNYVALKDENSVKIIFAYYFKQSVYAPDDYTTIKSYFKYLVEKGNEKLVLLHAP